MLFRESEDLLVINTGRALHETLPIVNAIGGGRQRFIIVKHGSRIFDLDTQSDLSLDALDVGGEEQEALQSIAAIQRVIAWYLDEGEARLAHRFEFLNLVVDRVVTIL